MKTLIAIPTKSRYYLYENDRGVFNYTRFMKDKDSDIVLFLKDDDVDLKPYLWTDYNSVVVNYDWFSELKLYMYQYAVENNYDKLVIFDDDIKLAYRETVDSPLKNITEDKFNELFTWMTTTDCAIAHPTLRFGANNAKTDIEYYKKAIRCVCIDVSCLNTPLILLNDMLKTIKFKSDYALQLTFLKMGLTTICNNLFTVDDGGLIPGGCVTNRNPELQGQAGRILQKAFPDVVSLRWKQNKTFTEKTVETTIQWKKAGKSNAYGDDDVQI